LIDRSPTLLNRTTTGIDAQARNMLGGFGRSSADHQQKVLALLNNPRVTDAQKAAYCYDNGCCDRCAIRTVFIGPFKRRPLTNDKVLNGVCRTCYPEQCVGGPVSVAPWDKMQKLVVPPEVLLAKTSDAFTSLQTSVSKGINNLNDNIKSTDMTDKSKAFTHETSKAFTSLHASVTGSINALNENIKKNTENIDVSSLQKGINDINTNRAQKKQSREALSNLKNAFSTQGDGEVSKEHNNSNAIDPKDLKGHLVATAYGRGFVREYRQEDEIFVVELSSGSTSPSTTTLFCKRESFDVPENTKKNQLNEAFEAMEKMRRLNLELECQERGVTVDYSKCTQCLLNPTIQPQSFGRIRKLMKNPALSCLFCGAPTCTPHSCPAMKKEGITACIECVKLFEPGYLVACVNEAHGLGIATTGTEGREENPLEMMIDLYDRVLLLLRYSSQYIESIAKELEENTKKYNNINAGASSTGTLVFVGKFLLAQVGDELTVHLSKSGTGIVSGALGVAAAAAIFTPAGPPLLIASLTLGK
jgi:glycine cleavage system H lipoate-binding protein